MSASIEVDTAELEDICRSMDKLKEDFPVVCQQMMNAINVELKKDLRNQAKGRGYQRSHNLYKGIFAYAGFKGKIKTYSHLYDNAGVGRPKGGYGDPKQPGKGYYAYAIECGHDWEGHNGKVLHVKMKQGWVTLKSIHVPARPFINATIRAWYGSKGNAVMERKYHEILKKRGIE